MAKPPDVGSVPKPCGRSAQTLPSLGRADGDTNNGLENDTVVQTQPIEGKL